jgi:glycosyltransferase involved in cell wall biosynthesis
MKILIANHHYFDLTGTETFVYTLAKSLKATGCSVTIYAPYIGGLIVQKTKELGIDVVDDLKLINPKDFDIAHVSHNLIAYKIRAWSLDIPIVFISHGVLPFLEQPPVDNLNISAYLSVSEEVRDNLIKKGVARKKISIFRNIIDTTRFCPNTSINPSPQKALINSRRIDADTRAIIESACARLQMNLVSIGDFGGVTFDVEKAINEVDIVFSLGRGILESMSCGRVAIVFDYNGGDGIVTPDNLDEIQKCNFSGRRFGLKFNSDILVAEIHKYTQELGKISRDIIIDRFSADKNINQLINFYRNAIESFVTVKINEKALNQLVNIIHETRSYSAGTLWRAYESRISNYEQTVKALQGIKEHLEAGLKEKDAHLYDINAELLQQKKAVADRDARLLETSLELNEIKTRFEAKWGEVEEKDRALKHALEESRTQRINFEEELQKKNLAMSKMEQDRNAEKANLEEELKQRGEQIKEINALFEKTSYNYEESLRMLRGVIEERQAIYDSDLAELKKAVSDLQDMVKQRDEQIKMLNANLIEKEEDIVQLKETIKEKDNILRMFEANLIEKEEDIVQLKETIKEKDDILRMKDDFIKQMYERITALEDEKIGILDYEIRKLSDKRRLLEEEGRIERQRLENEISDRDRRINDLLNSKSWKVTKLLRTIHDVLTRSG